MLHQVKTFNVGNDLEKSTRSWLVLTKTLVITGRYEASYDGDETVNKVVSS